MDELESEGLGLWQKYKLFIPAAVKNFLLKVAISKQWHKLKRELEK